MSLGFTATVNADLKVASLSESIVVTDIGNNLITGRNRNWARERRRNQVRTLSYFRSGWGGDHNFKIGGEIFDESVKDCRGVLLCDALAPT